MNIVRARQNLNVAARIVHMPYRILHGVVLNMTSRLQMLIYTRAVFITALGLHYVVGDKH